MAKQLNEQTCTQISEKLASFLANTFVLYVKTLNFHWNMQGPQFHMYHLLLQDQYENMAGANDDLAERIRMLGHPAPGTMAHLLQLSSLKESSKPLKMEQMVKELTQDHEEMVEQCHTLIAFVDEVCDQGTSDLMAERIRFHSKQAWLLRSHH